MKNYISMAWRYSFLIVCLSILYGCKKETIDGNINTDPAFADTLRSVPDIIRIDSNTLILTTFLYRDFMPSVPERKNGSGLICIDSLIDKNSLPIPVTLKIKKEYVVNGNQVWTSQPNGIFYQQPFIIEATTSNGPKWGPAIQVDVICEFEIGANTYRIIAKQQEIQAIN